MNFSTTQFYGCRQKNAGSLLVCIFVSERCYDMIMHTVASLKAGASTNVLVYSESDLLMYIK